MKSKADNKVKRPRGRPKGTFYKKPPIDTINQVLIDNYGIITQCAKVLDVQTKTLYSWIASSTKLQDTIKHSRERMIDVAESQLMKNINAGKETSLIFFLKCLAKQRGYVDRQEIDVNHTVQQIIINVSDPETKNLLENFNLTLTERKNPPQLNE